MNFQDLKKVENPDFYLDVAFSRAAKKINELRPKTKANKLQKSKTLELARIDIIRAVLSDSLRPIIKSFPSIENLDPFYYELIKITLDYRLLKKSLGSVDWAVKKIGYFFKLYKKKIMKASEVTLINKHRREFSGRISSVMKQIKKNLAYLEESRRVMKNYPAIKTSMFTVCIFGFPNVGKSTLLSKITSASPEIKPYPFTTKSLNLGYIKEPGYKIQCIDTPGTLNRIGKMNNIERQAHLAIKYLAEYIVFVFDPTEDMKKQERLLERLKEYNKPILLFLSKTDIMEGKSIKKKYQVITDWRELKKFLLKLVYQNPASAG